jgi:GNAT superfamily N-acetyltransferase
MSICIPGSEYIVRPELIYYFHMEKISSIQYVDPKKDLEEEGLGQHRFDLIVEGVKVGGAEINYFSKPLPLYQLTDLYIEPNFQGKGFGSQLIDRFEKMLLARKRSGVLVDAIFEDSKSKGMYERRGWKEVPESCGLYVFNWPENISLDVMKGYASRYTDYLERNK